MPAASRLRPAERRRASRPWLAIYAEAPGWETAAPIYEGARRIGHVHTRRAGHSLYGAIRIHGVEALVGARRVNRIDDPRAVYILADGSLWRGGLRGTPAEAIVAEIVGSENWPAAARQEAE